MLEAAAGGECQSAIVDAHNSRYESAPRRELAGITPDSRYMREYSIAIKMLRQGQRRARSIRAGFGSVDAYAMLGRPTDLARGMMNVAVFEIGGTRYAMVQFNSNNILPSLRNQILRRLELRFGLEGEVYTTDTHAVNSMSMRESNVLGRSVRYAALEPLLDNATEQALRSMERVDVYAHAQTLKGFMVWGREVKKQLFEVVDAAFADAKVLVPILIAAGFLVALWLISVL